MRLTAGQQFRLDRHRSGSPVAAQPMPVTPPPAGKVHAVSARVKHSNTPESDAQAQVMHIVGLSDGTTVEIMAEAPDDAISRVNRSLR